MIRNKYIAYALYVICFAGIWNLLDLAYRHFISGAGASGPFTGLGIPFVAAALSGYFLIFRRMD